MVRNNKGDYPKSLKEIDRDFYKKVKRRRKDLISRFKAQNEETLTNFEPMRNHIGRFLKEIETTFSIGRAAPQIIDLSAKDFWIDFKSQKNNMIRLPFFAFHYNNMFHEAENQVQRYVYFEIYFLDGILSVIMRHSAFSNSSNGFPAFDLDRKEWAQTKVQMELWQNVVRVESTRMNKWTIAEQFLYKYFIELEYKQDKKKAKKKKSNNNIKKEEFDKIAAIWPLVSYITLIQITSIFEEPKRMIFALNNKIEKTDIGIESALQIIFAFFSLKTKLVEESDIRIVKGGTLPKLAEKTNLPQIYFYEKPAGAFETISQIAKLKESRTYSDVFDYTADDMPVMFGKDWIVSNRVLNIEISSKDIYDISRDRELLDTLRDKLERNLTKYVKNKKAEEYKFYLYDDSPNDVRLDYYKNELETRFYKAYKKWRKWWHKSGIALLSTPYIAIAAWFTILYIPKFDSEFDDENNVIFEIKKTLMKEEGKLIGQLDALKKFLLELLNNENSYTHDMPSGQRAYNAVTEPIVHTFKGMESPCFILKRDVYTKLLKQINPDADANAMIDSANKKGLLKTSKNSPDCVVSFGKKDESPNKGYSERCYVFIKEKIENFLKT